MRWWIRGSVLAVLAAFVCLGAADGTPALPVSVTILTTDGELLTGHLDAYEEGFFLLRQEDRILRISPRHVDTVFTDEQQARTARENPATFAEQTTDRLWKAYLQLETPDREDRDHRFFVYCMDEAEAIARAVRQTKGRSRMIKAIDSLKQVTAGPRENPDLLLNPDHYRGALLILALMRENLNALIREARGARFPDRAAKLGEIREEYRTMTEILARAEEHIKASKLSQSDRETALERVKLLQDRWTRQDEQSFRRAVEIGGRRKGNLP